MAQTERQRMSPDDIKELLNLKGWNQSDLAREIDVDRAAVSMWLKGVRKPGGPAAKWMRRLLDESRAEQLAPAS